MAKDAYRWLQTWNGITTVLTSSWAAYAFSLEWATCISALTLGLVPGLLRLRSRWRITALLALAPITLTMVCYLSLPVLDYVTGYAALWPGPRQLTGTGGYYQPMRSYDATFGLPIRDEAYISSMRTALRRRLYNSTLRGMVGVFGTMRGSYVGPLPTPQEAILLFPKATPLAEWPTVLRTATQPQREALAAGLHRLFSIRLFSAAPFLRDGRPYAFIHQPSPNVVLVYYHWADEVACAGYLLDQDALFLRILFQPPRDPQAE